MIVLHYNGNPNPDVAVIEVYYCENGGEQNLMLGEIVRDELVTALRSVGYEPPSARVIEDIAVARGNRHFPSLGNVYEAPTTFIRNRYADADVDVVLTEPLYMTNATELAILQDDATHQAIAEALRPCSGSLLRSITTVRALTPFGLSSRAECSGVEGSKWSNRNQRGLPSMQ